MKLTKFIFIAGWVVMVLGIISNIDSTLYYHAHQYVSDGEKPEQLRILQLLGDIVYPIFQGLSLIGISYIIEALYDRKTHDHVNNTPSSN